MARIRTVKPEMAQDEDLSECSIEAQLLAVRILTHSDDEGYFRANTKLVKATCFPLADFDSMKIQGMLIELSNAGYLRLFEGSNGKEFGHVIGFTKHQRVNRPSPSKIAPFDSGESSGGAAFKGFNERSLNYHGGLTPGNEQGKEQGKEHEESAAKASPAAGTDPPKPEKKTKRGTRLPDDWTLTDEYREAAEQLRPDLIPVLDTVAGNFADYWHAKAGQGATKVDWLATWRNWLRNEKTNPGGPNGPDKPAHQSYAARRADLTDAVTNYDRATQF